MPPLFTPSPETTNTARRGSGSHWITLRSPTGDDVVEMTEDLDRGIDPRGGGGECPARRSGWPGRPRTPNLQRGGRGSPPPSTWRHLKCMARLRTHGVPHALAKFGWEFDRRGSPNPAHEVRSLGINERDAQQGRKSARDPIAIGDPLTSRATWVQGPRSRRPTTSQTFMCWMMLSLAERLSGRVRFELAPGEAAEESLNGLFFPEALCAREPSSAHLRLMASTALDLT